MRQVQANTNARNSLVWRWKHLFLFFFFFSLFHPLGVAKCSKALLIWEYLSKEKAYEIWLLVFALILRHWHDGLLFTERGSVCSSAHAVSGSREQYVFCSFQHKEHILLWRVQFASKIMHNVCTHCLFLFKRYISTRATRLCLWCVSFGGE